MAGIEMNTLNYLRLKVASITSSQGPFVRTCHLAPTWKGEDVFPYAQDITGKPSKVKTWSPYNLWVPLKDWIDHGRMQARSCQRNAFSAPWWERPTPPQDQQALPVQRPEVLGTGPASDHWQLQAFFLLTGSSLFDSPQFPYWLPPRYYLTTSLFFSAHTYLIYSLFSFVCVCALRSVCVWCVVFAS